MVLPYQRDFTFSLLVYTSRSEFNFQSAIDVSWPLQLIPLLIKSLILPSMGRKPAQLIRESTERNQLLNRPEEREATTVMVVMVLVIGRTGRTHSRAWHAWLAVVVSPLSTQYSRAARCSCGCVTSHSKAPSQVHDKVRTSSATGMAGRTRVTMPCASTV